MLHVLGRAFARRRGLRRRLPRDAPCACANATVPSRFHPDACAARLRRRRRRRHLRPGNAGSDAGSRRRGCAGRHRRNVHAVPAGRPVSVDQQELYFGDLRLVASYSCGPDDTRKRTRARRERRRDRREGRRDAGIARRGSARLSEQLATKPSIIKPIVTLRRGNHFDFRLASKAKVPGTGRTTSSAREVTRHATRSETT